MGQDSSVSIVTWQCVR